MINNSDLSLVKKEEHLIQLKKIQSEILNTETLDKVDIKEGINKKIRLKIILLGSTLN